MITQLTLVKDNAGKHRQGSILSLTNMPTSLVTDHLTATDKSPSTYQPNNHASNHVASQPTNQPTTPTTPRTKAEQELARERREKASLALQLTEDGFRV